MSNTLSAARRPLAMACALLAATAAQAQPTQPTVLVTATRTPITVDEALASVSVITRDDIESAGGVDVTALLRREAGLDIVPSGGLGQQTSVFLRGASSNQLLVLIDGVRVASTNSGSYPWEHLPLAQVERIEIVRGPRAALYGSDAIGGVIHIFTRRGEGASAAVGVGSYGTWLAEAGFGQRSERTRFNLRGAYTHSDGFSAQNERGFSHDPDRDGTVQRSLNADVTHDTGPVQLDASALLVDNDVEFDRGESNNERRSARVALSGGEQQAWSLAAAHAREILDTPSSGNRFESRRRQLDWQHALQAGARGELLWGLSWAGEQGANLAGEPRTRLHGGERDHRAGFASWRDAAGPWQWELAARHDDYDGFGGRTSSQAALGWQLAAHSRLRLSMAEGFRAPSLNELYSPGFGGGFFAGNPALAPERSRAYELGAEYRIDALWLSLRAYRNDVRDLVDFSGGDTFQAINVGRARLQGAEADWTWQAERWSLSGNVSWLDARNRLTDARLLRRAPRKANLIAEHAVGDGRLGVELHAVSARPEFGGELPGYAVASAFLRWPLARGLDLDLRLDNLTDRDYEIVRGFNTAGLSGLVQLRWHASH